MIYSSKFIFKIISLILLLLVSINAQYLDSKSCKECHEEIYNEHITTMHHQSALFKDQFHRNIKQITTPDKYSCALCHIPAAMNLRDVMDGSEQPSPHNQREMDGVSCFYCHQITKVLETKHRNINFYSYAENTKPKFFGNLVDPGDSDKHTSDINTIYKNSQVCMGCHGKKYNKYNVQICNGYNEFDKTSDCIGCHMPKLFGGVTKLNKKGREEHSSHEFLGIRSPEMVKKAVSLKLKLDGDKLLLTIKNKMGHNLIMQPMRLKFVQTTIERNGQIIWKNYDKRPLDDTEATFTRLFTNDKDNRVFPPFATKISFNNNIAANSTKTITYNNLPPLKKGDIIKSQWVSYVVRPSLAKTLKLTDEKTLKKYLGVSTTLEVK